ncbi:MAG: universal stress protein [bacterium]|nr:universal stress protein [bacterium]
MKVLFYDEGQKYSKTALNFFAGIFGSTNADVTIFTVDKESAAKTESYMKSAQETLKKKGFKNTDVKTYSGPAQKVLKQELGADNDIIFVKGMPEMNSIIAEVAEQDIDEVSKKILANLRNSVLFVKNPPKQLRKVLICTDGSAEAEGAIDFFSNLKLDPQPQVKILNVIPSTFKFFKSYLEPAGESELAVLVKIKNKRTKFLYNAKQILAKAGIKAKIKLRTGNAVDEIIKESEMDFDLIVLGLRGRKASTKDTIGRQAKEALIRAKCSVLAVRGAK